MKLLARRGPALVLAVCCGGLLHAVAAERAAGQEFRGDLRDEADGAPLRGAMITVLDTTGVIRNAVLTNAQGGFRVAAPGPGRYYLQIELIGYRTVTVGPLDVIAGQSPTLALRMETQPIAIDAVEVSGGTACSVRPDDSALAYRLWDEAAKALRSTAVLQDLELVEYTVETYEQDVSLTMGRTHTERQPARRVRGRPFSTLDAATLANRGWVEVLDDEVLYHGPDAQVLLADQFLDTHCLRVERSGADRTGLIGLAFEPVPDRTLPDVEGVLWLDAATGALQHLTYSYTSLPDLVTEADGRIEFDRLESGAWVVRNWRIRMTHSSTPRVGPDAGRRVPTGYREMGGRITDVILPGA